MYLTPFYVAEPRLAAQETRVMNLLVPQGELPVGSYGLLEFYCPDPKCNCRRVMLNVVEEKSPDKILAAISYGFDREEEDAGPFLDPLNPQTQFAEELLRLVQSVILSDPRYIARLEHHYHMVKRAASDPSHPAYKRLQEVLADDATSFPLPRPARKLRKDSRKLKTRRKRGKK